MWITIIEWDGGVPPTKWYNRLHSIGLRVRGDKGTQPIPRRQSEGTYKQTVEATALELRMTGDRDRDDAHVTGSVIVQEGLIYTASETLARTIGLYAYQQGAKLVLHAECQTAQPITAGNQDLLGLAQMERVLGQRGRPSGNPITWTVLCLEEASLYTVEAREVFNCPSCHGFAIRARPGEPYSLSLSQAGTVVQGWLHSRFWSGMFDKPIIDPNGPGSQFGGNYRSMIERAAAEIITQSSVHFEALATAIGDAPAMDAIDAVFCSLVFLDADRRTKARIQAVTQLFASGTPASQVLLVQKPDVTDVLDGTAILGADRAARYWKRAAAFVKTNGNNNHNP